MSRRVARSHLAADPVRIDIHDHFELAANDRSFSQSGGMNGLVDLHFGARDFRRRRHDLQANRILLAGENGSVDDAFAPSE